MTTEKTNAIEMRHIVKKFGDFKANDDINLTLHQGEILALLGENGAGKSTLMRILSGLLEPTSGEIFVKGKKVEINSPTKAKELGIGMVHQHFMLMESFTVLENIILGHEPTNGIVLNIRKAREQILKLSEKYGLAIDPDAQISNITVAQQQRVEILKVLYRGADILIFDEPTAVLTPQEITEFIQIIKNLAKEGKSIILITHKLSEIKAVADQVTIIRRGRDVGTFEVANVDDNRLAELMVGHHVNMKLNKKSVKLGREILKVENLKVKNTRGSFAVKKLSLNIHGGEILGLAGIDGNGQDELVEAITGLRHVNGGKVIINGQNMTNKKVRQITEAGVAHIPADRQKYGLILNLPLAENLVLQTYYKQPYSKHGIINHQAIYEHAEELIKKYDIRTTSAELPASDLSGGNQQKAIIARELDRNSDLIIAFQPTRGLDVGAIEYIHKQLLAERDAGKAVLLVSYELDEIMQLSDRIAVLHDGKISGEVKPEDTNDTELGLLMTGIKKEGAVND
ncbi:ABC transporter ATP-binding protein [Lactobacillus amylovorus]|jgi:simple sugar transport system ATP-binding protein|uniref:ABC transporter ATP-binding protein n=1 Tax=Lactobacillus amylovorus TaxID=1604 RepID=A0AAW6BBQ6_LACAM|nr:ABC transporter ATP-binding protein [Lactobacillus amylovorus]MCT3585155.1 ABC transporter ATP-binding protein [Lactobacillus amylovorus]MDA6090127.1 ABC transporter ATP-binding protein [Lactobacillus amylovorus]MDB6222497.1 ABC transporter ATP-binding protein [Lactobacillus amylovorus]MDB6238934.1 ABC transporter ATP-binding protein [Lactobacillus amylovorus]MDB6247428.1 ABC transporter ATP-binding protein [Lactobacillus amylovorus]